MPGNSATPLGNNTKHGDDDTLGDNDPTLNDNTKLGNNTRLCDNATPLGNNATLGGIVAERCNNTLGNHANPNKDGPRLTIVLVSLRVNATAWGCRC